MHPHADAAPSAAPLYVVFMASGHRFAVPYQTVEQMVSPPERVGLPNAHPAVRGVINLRGEVLGLVSLRGLIGAPSFREENALLVAELDHREEDHVAWLAELEASTREGRSFSLTTDPHACRFGRWYDTYTPANADVRALVTRLGPPHAAIHAIADEVVTLARSGRREDALALIAQTRDRELGRLTRMLVRLRDYLTDWSRDIALVLQEGTHSPLALLVDAVESVSTLRPTPGGDHGQESHLGALFPALATDAEDRVVNLLRVDALYEAIAA